MIKGQKWKRFTVLFDYSEFMDEWYINAFEKKYKICFPETYKELMRKHNGANFKEDYFNFINLNGEYDIRSFGFDAFGENVKENGPSIEYYNKNLQDQIYYGVPGLIGFGSTAEGDTVCFDYREDAKSCDPKVVVLVHDEYDEEPDGTIHMHIEPIASSFDDFLEILYEYVDEDDN